MIKVLRFYGYVKGYDREVTGTVNIDGADFKFDLSTDDGMTSIYLTDAEGREASCEDETELAEIGLGAFAEYELYDEILCAVNEEYELED